jgi:hypothetical protein
MAKYKFFRTDQKITDLAYLAGIIDGEGCFYIGHIKQGIYGNCQQFHTLISISNNNENLIKWLDNTFRASSDSRYKYQSNLPHEKPTFRWTAGGQLLDFLLPKIYPFLQVKKPHCEVMIEMRKTFTGFGSQGLPQNILERRFALLKQMRKLNTRFHNHPLKQECALAPCHPS